MGFDNHRRQARQGRRHSDRFDDHFGGGFDHSPPRSFDAPRNTGRPASGPAPLARSVTAVVKWFNAEKGFGFVSPQDGSPDAFLHVSSLQDAGHDSLPEGATLVVDLVQGGKGPQVGAVHSVDASTAQPGRAPQRPRPGRDAGPTEEVDGQVKWFNATKGFGFVAPDCGGKDVFVHISALQRSGVGDLRDGQRVRMQVRQGAKGPEAASVEV